jgi:hypothetical protein
MPTITDELSFGGAIEKIRRLGLGPLYQELRGIITSFTLNVLEERTRKGRTARRRSASCSTGRSA